MWMWYLECFGLEKKEEINSFACRIVSNINTSRLVNFQIVTSLYAQIHKHALEHRHTKACNGIFLNSNMSRSLKVDISE